MGSLNSTMLLKAVTLSFLSTILATDYEWLAWKQQHAKKYTGVEDQRRYKIFQANRVHVARHNALAANGEETYTLGLTKFADMDVEEFERTYLSAPIVGTQFPCPEQFQDDGSTIPTSWDWRSASENSAGIVTVTAVKDQGPCGSCWTFGANAAMEGGMCINGEQDCSTWAGLSEQQLVDCASNNRTFLGNYNNNGCGGGEQSNAMRWVYLNGGITDGSDYPYTSGSTGKATTRQGPPNVGMTTDDICGTTSYAGADANLLAQATMAKGPVTVGIDAGGINFSLYSGGVYSSNTCSGNRINHAVTEVGFGVEDGTNMAYWIVKNSWGSSWGMDGYILMERGVDMCGI